jgi:hypothetical protein
VLPGQTVVVVTAAESHLGFLAQQALARAGRDDSPVTAAGLMAVADAYVMLGLLTSPEADQVLAEARDALTSCGQSMRTAGSAADSYRLVRAHDRTALSWLPQAVAACTARLTAGSSDLRLDWLRLSRAGVRLQVLVTAVGNAPPPRKVPTDLSIADDTGRDYPNRWDVSAGTSMRWAGDVVADAEIPGDVTYFELRVAGSTTAHRVVMPPPPPVPTGIEDPPWPTPSECYLALLSAQDPPPEIGKVGGKLVVATVAGALLAVGALPADSALLPRVLGRQKRSDHPVLPTTWPIPVRRDTPPDFRLALCTALPFDSAAAVIEGMSAWGETIQLHVYGWPWVHGERWPMAIPCFTVRATDDLGGEHDGRPGSWHLYGAGEGRGDFTLWPAVPKRVSRLRVVVSTLWEAAWADIDLPG